MYILHIVIQYL